LVVADTLELETGSYQFGDKEIKNLIIVADTIQVKGLAAFFTFVPGGEKAGDLILIARRYVVEETGCLIFRNKGTDQNSPPGHLFLFADERTVRAKCFPGGISHIFDPNYAIGVEAGPLEETFRDLGKMWIDRSINPESLNPKIPNGRYIVGSSAAIHLGAIAYLIGVTVSGRKTPSSLDPDEQETLIRLVKEGQALSPIATKLLTQGEQSKFQVLESKTKISEAANLLTLWTEEFRLSSNASVQLVYDGKAQEVFLAPMGSLMRVVVQDDRRYLGYLDRHPQDPAQAVLSFDVKLSVDTDVEQEVSDTLAKRAGFRYKGRFSDYVVNKSYLGTGLSHVKSEKVTVSRDTVHVELGLDPQLAGLALTSLASSSGVPLHLEWSDRTGNVKGAWQIPISLARRDSIIDVEKSAEGIRNIGKVAVTVEYLLLPDDRVFPLEPPLTLQPGDSKPFKDIPLPPTTDFNKVDIPRSAVTYSVTEDPLREIFVRDPSIVDTVEITNLLSAHDQMGALRYVEIFVTYAYDPSEATAPAVKGPFRLASRGAMGDQFKVSFLRRRRGDRDITIAGVAEYDKGRQTLKPRTFHSLAAAIEQDMLPAQ
jgi:hypothetical protein